MRVSTASTKGPPMLLRLAWLGVRHLPLLLEEAAERSAERLGIVRERLSGRRTDLGAQRSRLSRRALGAPSADAG